MVKNSREVKTKPSKGKNKGGKITGENGGDKFGDGVDHITSSNVANVDTLSDEYTIAGDNDSTSVVSLLEDDDAIGCTFSSAVLVVGFFFFHFFMSHLLFSNFLFFLLLLTYFNEHETTTIVLQT
jgi:hypothetical protein